MSVQRLVDSKFWSDSFIVDCLNPLDRYLFLYFLTNERTNLSGVYEVPLRTISNETGIEKEEILRMLERLRGKIEYKNGWICLVNFTKHQNLDNKNIVKGIDNKIVLLPEDIKSWVFELRNMSHTPLIDESYMRTEKGKERKGKELKGKKLKETYGGVQEQIDDKFWNQYPEKVAKAKAHAVWVKMTDEEKQKAIIAIQKQVENNHFKGRDGQDYIPHPATWLNQKRWEDEVKEVKKLDIIKFDKYGNIIK